MISFEEYEKMVEKSFFDGVEPTSKHKVTIEELKEMIANKDSSIAYMDVSSITDMSYLFKDSDFGSSWTADLSGWNTSKVRDMSAMFYGCRKLRKVSLPHTENVTHMMYMFDGCESLTNVTLPHTEKVVDMSAMFYDCINLIKVDLPHIENVTHMMYMFDGCKNLLQDFSNWDVNDKRKSEMFRDCTRMEQSYKNGHNYYPKGYKA